MHFQCQVPDRFIHRGDSQNMQLAHGIDKFGKTQLTDVFLQEKIAMTNISNDKHQAKKDLILGKSGKSNKSLYMILSLVLIVVTAFAAAYLYPKTAPSDFIADAAAIDGQETVTAQAISYPVSLFQDGVARHFEHKTGDTTIRYFILKSSDNVVRAAFDACDVCWRSGKGYAQDGDQMVCRNCGRRFSSVKINEVQGGCNPAPLNRSINGDQLVILIQDIIQGKQYFNFKERA